MNNDYLARVVIFLQQKQPQYKSHIRISNGIILLQVPDGSLFQPYFEAVQGHIIKSIGRHKLQFDLDFSVCSPNQQRDFRLYRA